MSKDIGPKPVLRGGRPAKTPVGALHRAAKRVRERQAAAVPKAPLGERVRAWIKAHPKATAGDAVAAFPEFRDAAEFFAFTVNGIVPSGGAK